MLAAARFAIPQVGFYEFVALPLVRAATEAFPGVRPLLECFRSNYYHWRLAEAEAEAQAAAGTASVAAAAATAVSRTPAGATDAAAGGNAGCGGAAVVAAVAALEGAKRGKEAAFGPVANVTATSGH